MKVTATCSRIAVIGVCAVALLLGGCETASQVTRVSGEVIENGDTAWPFWPRAMRIHPLTRVVENYDGDELVIEARIEFSDAFGSTTKGVGQMRLELIETARGFAGELLEEWEIDLRQMNTNAQRFDDITRTYLFRLRIDPQRFSHTAELHAYFLSINGARMSAEFALER